MLSFRQFLTENEEKAKKTIRWLGDHISKDSSSSASIHALSKEDGNFAYAVQNHPSYKAGEDISHIMAHLIAHHMDPTPDKRYSQWAYQGWQNATHQFEDHPRVKEALTRFHANKRVLGNTIPEYQPHIMTTPNIKKGSDINAYPDLHSLETHMDKVLNPNKQEHKGEFSHPDAPLIHDQNGLKVHSLESKEASIHTRKCFDNKWCTARDDEHNMYHDYTYDHMDEHGNVGANLYYVHTPDNKHWQFHFQTDSFADQNDVMHKPESLVEKYPELKQVEAFHHYGLKSIPFAKNEAHAHSMIDDHINNNHHYGGPMEDDDVKKILKHGTSEHIDKLLDGEPSVHHLEMIASHPNTQEHHIHRVLDQADYLNRNSRILSHRDVYNAAIDSGHESVLERLSNSEHPLLREKIANEGHFHDKLINDPSAMVRAAVANETKNKAHLDKLVDDPHPSVQLQVAYRGHPDHMEKLYKHTNPIIQSAVAINTNDIKHLDYIRKYGNNDVSKKQAEHRYWKEIKNNQ